MPRSVSFLIASLLLTVTLTAGSLLISDRGGDQNPEIVAVFYPFYDIAKQVAGEAAEVDVLVPPGTDPHNFEPSPDDIRKIRNADLLIVTGAEFESWERQLIREVEGSTSILDPSNNIDLLPLQTSQTEELRGEEANHSSAETNHVHGTYDPHYWLSPSHARMITEQIAERLTTLFPEKSGPIDENRTAYLERLDRLDRDFQQRLSNCRNNTILTTHPAMNYLAREYGFEQVAMRGIGPLSEPSARTLNHLAETARLHNLNHVFYDATLSPRVAQVIAREAGAETLRMYSAAVPGDERGEIGFIEMMERNLSNLERALQCGENSHDH